MINLKEEFLRTVYKFYPKDILGLDNSYNEQKEIIKLINTSKKRVDNDYKKWLLFKSELSKLFNNEKTIIDKTTFFISQPSFSIQVSCPKKVISYNVYYSFLIPYYYVSRLTVIDKKTIELAVNDDWFFEVKLIEIELLIQSFFDVQMFPKKLLEEVVNDVYFETIESGEFTFRNAFFNKKQTLI